MKAPDPFADRPALRIRFERERRAILGSRIGIACWLAILLVPFFAALDVILHPHLLVPLFAIRLAIIALAGAVVLTLRTRSGRRYVRGLSFFVFYLTGFGIILMTSFTGGGSSPYYAGVTLVMLAAAVVMPFDVRLSVACCVTLTLSYAGYCLAVSGVPDPRVFIGNLFFLFSTSVITVVSHVLGAKAHQREFFQRVALEEANRHRDEFLANITHELRTPLAAILGFCEMLADYMLEATSEQRTWLARIRDNALTLYRLIVQLLDFAKMEAGAMRLTREHCRLENIVTKVGADMRAIAGAGGVSVAVEIGPDTPAVIGDPGRIEEIVTNLAINALKFSGGRPILLGLTHGGIEREPAWQRIIPEPGPEAFATVYVQVYVTDRGEGIRLDDVRRLFVAFQQLDGSSTRRQGGTGLGLTISARLAAAMRGHVAVHSTPGVGSTFALLIPAAPAAPARAGAEDPGCAAGTLPALVATG